MIWRRLTPAQEDAVRASVAAGADPGALAGAYGVSRRTILRTLQRYPRSVQTIELAGYRACFEVSDEGPVQLTPWVAA